MFDSDLEDVNEGNAIENYDEEPDEGHSEEEAEEEGVEVEADNCVSAEVKQLAPKNSPE